MVGKQERVAGWLGYQYEMTVVASSLSPFSFMSEELLIVCVAPVGADQRQPVVLAVVEKLFVSPSCDDVA